jgi:AcrR family transcriptional regulator
VLRCVLVAKSDSAPGPGLRERKKRQTRERIRACAIRFFLDQGYEATSVAEIAAAANVSHMTFFRYFPTKQDVVDLDDDPEELAELIRGRPAGESALVAAHQATLQLLDRADHAGRAERKALLDVARLIMDNAPLRAWLWEKHHVRERAIADALAARSAGSAADFRAAAAASVAVTGAAFASWVAGGGTTDLRTEVDDAFTALYRAVDPAL